MKLTVNGEPVILENGQSVRDLIVQLGLEGRAVAVEVNRRLIARSEHETAILREGDEVELVTLVGGG